MGKNVSIEPALDIWGTDGDPRNIERSIPELKEIDKFLENEGKTDDNESHEDFVAEKDSDDTTIIHEEHEENIEVLETFQIDHPSMNVDAIVEEDDDSDEDEDAQLEVSINYEVKNTTSVLLTGTVVLLIMLARGRKSRNQ